MFIRHYIQEAGLIQGTLVFVVLSLFALGAADLQAQEKKSMETLDEKIPKLEKSKKEWRELLEKDAYRVLFEEATERPFTSPLDNEKHAGTFVCAACYLPLFESKTKFDSGTGWPSFYQPIPGRLGTKKDFKITSAQKRVSLYSLWGSSGAYIQRRPSSDGPEMVQQRCCSSVRPDSEELPLLRK